VTGTPCVACLRRTALLARLAPHVDRAREQGRRLPLLLGLPDDDLVAALAGGHEAEIESMLTSFDADASRDTIAAVGLTAVCRCTPGYPEALRGLPDAPAVLHLAGAPETFSALVAQPAVAVVGARRGSAYGLEVARALGRGLSAAGVTVVSGMALGVDSAAHAGALEAGGRTIAVLAGGADVPYPPSKRELYRRIESAGAVVAELPPGTRPWRWGFPARNRLIAALASVVVVVEAGEQSGSLITSGIAEDIGRDIAAVPGRVTSSLAAGPNALIATGAHLVRDAGDVLDLIFGARPYARHAPPVLEPELQQVLDHVSDGRDTLGALTSAGVDSAEALTALSELELAGHIRRAPGGRFVAAG
jgi:DNA processing protein